jgi:hypothetical protein
MEWGSASAGHGGSASANGDLSGRASGLLSGRVYATGHCQGRLGWEYAQLNIRREWRCGYLVVRALLSLSAMVVALLK